MGTNPCGEQSLEDREFCCLVETFPSRHETYEEYQRTLKYAYMYGKTVTLLNTKYPKTNNVMLKNRRMGISQTGIIDAFARHGRREVLDWCDKGYGFLKALDKQYSYEWLCVTPSIKITSVKPSGTVSLLAGVSPGIHYPHAEYYIRRIRFSKDNKLLEPLKEAGYNVYGDPWAIIEGGFRTYCVDFPLHEKYFKRAKDDVSMWEQMQNVVDYQRYWADNQVSITITFKPEESKDIPYLLETSEDKIKGVSLLPLLDHSYEAAPYETITKEKYDEMISKLQPFDLDNIKYDMTTEVAKGAKGCSTDVCELKLEIGSIKTT
jgi:adenosylcobalamin-dependent ribonucleoside-triphosphate reductase